MKMHILGSSSRGNCYVLQSEDTGKMLIVEAGVRFGDVKRAIGFDISKVVGCIVSHEHGDHAKYVRDYVENCIDVYTSKGTIERLSQQAGERLEQSPFVHWLYPSQPKRIGDFGIIPFPVEHDAEEPFGYMIRHRECGTVVFATDTYYLRYKFEGVSNWLIECNYRRDLLDRNFKKGKIDYQRRERTLKSHMSYEQCLSTLKANDLSQTINIVLIHLSDDNSNEKEFVDGIWRAIGKEVFAAKKGMVIDFNDSPY